MNQHGYCPNCGMNFDGDLIFDTFMAQYDGDEEKALKTASMYGRRLHSCFSKKNTVRGIK